MLFLVNCVARSAIHFIRFTFHPGRRALHLFAPFISESNHINLIHGYIGEAAIARSHNRNRVVFVPHIVFHFHIATIAIEIPLQFAPIVHFALQVTVERNPWMLHVARVSVDITLRVVGIDARNRVGSPHSRECHLHIWLQVTIVGKCSLGLSGLQEEVLCLSPRRCRRFAGDGVVGPRIFPISFIEFLSCTGYRYAIEAVTVESLHVLKHHCLIVHCVVHYT